MDVHDLAGAYAVDALPDEERRFFERHLDDCVDCRGEVDDLQVTAALLGTAVWEEPPAGMRDRVLATAAATPQEAVERPQTPEREPAPEREPTPHRGAVSAQSPPPPTAPTQGPPPPTALEPHGPRERLRQLLPAVAAVIVLGVAGVTVVVTQTGVEPPGDAQLAAVLASPDVQLVDMTAPDGATARVVWSPQRAEGVFLTDGLGAAPDGHAYALWVIEGESQPELAGMFQPDADGQARHAIADQLAGAVTVAVTVEPEGGVEQPTTEPIIVGQL